MHNARNRVNTKSCAMHEKWLDIVRCGLFVDESGPPFVLRVSVAGLQTQKPGPQLRKAGNVCDRIRCGIRNPVRADQIEAYIKGSFSRDRAPFLISFYFCDKPTVYRQKPRVCHSCFSIRARQLIVHDRDLIESCALHVPRFIPDGDKVDAGVLTIPSDRVSIDGEYRILPHLNDLDWSARLRRPKQNSDCTEGRKAHAAIPPRWIIRLASSGGMIVMIRAIQTGFTSFRVGPAMLSRS